MFVTVYWRLRDLGTVGFRIMKKGFYIPKGLKNTLKVKLELKV